jgi:hypothetical protein
VTREQIEQRIRLAALAGLPALECGQRAVSWEASAWARGSSVRRRAAAGLSYPTVRPMSGR